MEERCCILIDEPISGLVGRPGCLGAFLVCWGTAMTFVATPILTYFFGKRGIAHGCAGAADLPRPPGIRSGSDQTSRSGLADRAVDDPFRSRVYHGDPGAPPDQFGPRRGTAGRSFEGFSQVHGFIIGAVFSGVVGVGFYPIFGSRVWCRIGCPMAAVLGILQKYFSRFRITTKDGQCNSCGNCSTYCEMGIDVRAYTQKRQHIIRSSRVGCGICPAVCPRGVLKLETRPPGEQFSVGI